jgi:hypothetical protein
MGKIEPKFKKYGKSAKGNFEVSDSIGVPHPYCITPKHLEYNDTGILDEAAIQRAEMLGAVCDICKKRHNKTGEKILSYNEHKQALLVNCYKDLDKNKEEIKSYLLKIKDKAEAENYAGFAFKQAF